jgi:hypothetical protein
MAIGSLWLPRSQKSETNEALKKLRREIGLHGEIKWSKVSRAKLSQYKQIIDFFFDRELDFRVIVIDHSRIDYETFHDGDRELGFYKFYYQALIKWINPEDQYLILLDFKQNRGSDRYGTLRRVIENSFPGADFVLDLTVIDSSESSLAQLTDLLTGAVAAAWSGFDTDSPKKELAEYMPDRSEMLDYRKRPSWSATKATIYLSAQKLRHLVGANSNRG